MESQTKIWVNLTKSWLFSALLVRRTDGHEPWDARQVTGWPIYWYGSISVYSTYQIPERAWSVTFFRCSDNKDNKDQAIWQYPNMSTVLAFFCYNDQEQFFLKQPSVRGLVKFMPSEECIHWLTWQIWLFAWADYNFNFFELLPAKLA